MIHFGKITIEWFGSIKYLEYNLGRTGINIITGDNGVGKTTILNALSWVVYGQLIKPGCSIEPWGTVKDDGYKGTRVTVVINKLDEQIKIVRCKDYRGKINGNKGGNGVFIFVDDKLLSKKYKRNIQPHIINWIGYSFNLFKNAILFGQEVERLMKETGPNKRKVFEEAFDTLFIDRAKEKVENSIWKDGLYLTELALKKANEEERLEDWCKNTTKLIAQLDENVREYEGSIRKTKDIIKELKIDQVQYNIPELEATKQLAQKKKEEYQKKVNPKLPDEEFGLDMYIKGANIELEILKEYLKGAFNDMTKKRICIECKRPIQEEEARKQIKNTKKKIKEFRGLISEKKKLIKQFQYDYDKVKTELSNQKDYTLKVSQMDAKIKVVEASFSIYQKIREKISIRKAGIRALQKNIQSQVKKKLELKKNEDGKQEILDKISSLSEEMNKLDKKVKINNWLIKDPLSNTGLKAYIFEAQLAEINRNLRQYTQDIGFRIKIWVDLESARKDICISIFRDKEKVPYEDLSGGQKQLTDIALSFALNDTITKNRPINILLMDELFERLSKKNIEIVTNMVLKRSQKAAIQLITHNSSFNPTGAKKLYLQLNKKGHTVAA